MGDLVTFDSFSIKSKISGRYKVSFIDNLIESLNQKSKIKNQIFIIDSKLNDFFSDEINFIRKSNSKYIFIDANEKNKSYTYAQQIIEKLLESNIDKKTVLVAIGGGITQDLVAYISTILFRGLNWCFYPSTLLAQCDSCIGSKSSINFNWHKNIIGTFLPPNEIFIYSKFLNTLPISEIKSGIGEMSHYFLGVDNDIFENLFSNYSELLSERENLNHFIYKSLQIKKKIIEIDEFDTKERQIFNYGHTFGHAIESVLEYNIPHGQAVTIGINIANYISMEKKLISSNTFFQILNTLKVNVSGLKIKSIDVEKYFIALSKDKKNLNGKLGCILINEKRELKKYYIKLDFKLKNQIVFFLNEYLKKLIC